MSSCEPTGSAIATAFVSANFHVIPKAGLAIDLDQMGDILR